MVSWYPRQITSRGGARSWSGLHSAPPRRLEDNDDLNLNNHRAPHRQNTFRNINSATNPLHFCLDLRSRLGQNVLRFLGTLRKSGDLSMKRLAFAAALSVGAASFALAADFPPPVAPPPRGPAPYYIPPPVVPPYSWGGFLCWRQSRCCLEWRWHLFQFSGQHVFQHHKQHVRRRRPVRSQLRVPQRRRDWR